MSNDVEVMASRRTVAGSGEVRKLRQEGLIPAVVYSGGGESSLIQMNQHDFELMLSRHGSESMMIGLSIDGEPSRQVLLKEVQHHPISGHVLHVDFHAVAMDKKIAVNIPIELVGDAKGVLAGGVLDHPLREIELECLPGDIVELIEVDVTALGIGDTMTVADIELDHDKFSVLSDPELAVASVVQPRKAEEELAEEEAATGAEPKVIGEEESEESGD
jgi:large subunit ribosomal protein L25